MPPPILRARGENLKTMQLNIHDLSYVHPNREVLFTNVNLSLAAGAKAALIGHNGTGKSTLMRLIAGELAPASGSVAAASRPYVVPQHFGNYDGMTIAQALGVDRKITALRAILSGDLSDANYAALSDDWDIEERVAAALERWGLGGYDPGRSLATMSGGEKTRAFLAGIDIHDPALILMDEPTNHLDRTARQTLYELVGDSRAAILVVSHDRTLLNLLDTTYELTPTGVNTYGGNYEFYKEVRYRHLNALQESVGEKEKALRKARAVAREAAERKQKNDSRGAAKKAKEGVPRIMMNTIRSGAEKSGAHLKDVHERKLGAISQELSELRGRIPDGGAIKVKYGSSGIHRGKTLVVGDGVNFGYGSGVSRGQADGVGQAVDSGYGVVSDGMLWREPLDFRIETGDRIVVRGPNGSGKTTLVGLMLGRLVPAEGILARADFSCLYIDQEYSFVDDRLTVLEQVEKYNDRELPGHILKTELHRFRFPADTWDKKCSSLSGGEKMKLIFCCLIVSNAAPDVFILDEPTNNLDIQSLEIVTRSLRDYRGTLIVISHDEYFLREIGITSEIVLQ